MAITTNQVSTGQMQITVSDPPATPTSDGNPGTIAWDLDFIYVCIAPNTWARTNVSIFWG